jgi:hypothetical protein
MESGMVQSITRYRFNCGAIPGFTITMYEFEVTIKTLWSAVKGVFLRPSLVPHYSALHLFGRARMFS